ncbi:Imm49 family immunity protein [Myxococcus qinghaiensis]|uniref:Imm49 family immunity protein n=1 Tax=Myxococcus qinghaiensis TaxID=2906758 RepID=UPI0020A714FE|nr:Imm49 family immunity protein [Myxococcus qinghaiensis]MCP3165928.1 immunity 49 family protein [Myxococcus qinghaiensis]
MARLISLRADAADSLGERLSRFDPGADRPSLLTRLDGITLDLHVIAVATLLVDGNPQGFFLNLCRMAENARRLHLLLEARGLPPPPARRNTPLLGALGAGHFPLAEAVAAASSTQWQQGAEYEDEFLWASALQLLARTPPASPVALERVLVPLEKVGKEPYASRVAVARALASSDRTAFAEAFSTACLEHGLDIEKRARSQSTPVTSFAPHRFIWLEGLALLRLAERAGIAPEDTSFRYCPPLARVPMTVTYTGDWALQTTPAE